MKTALGSVLDPLADKILMTTLTISLAISETISRILILLPLSILIINCLKNKLIYYLQCVYLAYLSFLIISRDVGLVVAAAYMRYKSLPPPVSITLNIAYTYK